MENSSIGLHPAADKLVEREGEVHKRICTALMDNKQYSRPTGLIEPLSVLCSIGLEGGGSSVHEYNRGTS